MTSWYSRDESFYRAFDIKILYKSNERNEVWKYNMNKREISEIRKILTKENTHIDRICCCYVDANKEKKAVFQTSFYNVEEDEMFKYSDIFRKTLSGTIGKNIYTLEFPLKEAMEGEKASFLQKLVNSNLSDDQMNEIFFDRIISNYSYPENYLIILAHGVYDIPFKTKDNNEVFDGSEYVYNFMLCSLCPVNLSKPGLCYDDENKTFVGHIRDWMVQMPQTGFLYPAFNDRNTDLYSILYYSKNANELHEEFTEEIIGCFPPVAAKEQMVSFSKIVEDAFKDECSFEVVKEIQENLNKIVEEKKGEPEPAALEKTDIIKILSESGAPDSCIEKINETFDTEPGRTEKLLVSNITNTKKLEVKSPDIKIQVSADRTDLINTMTIDDREYIVIPLTDDIEINGIKVKGTKIQE